LKLSFGWNLAGTPAQDGQTFFFQSNTTKGGHGIYGNAKSYIEIDGARLGMLRYGNAIYGYGSSNNWKITSPTCNGNNTGVSGYSNCNNWIVTSPVCCGNVNNGVYGYLSFNRIISNPICLGNDCGIYASTGSIDWKITNPTCNGNTNGFFMSGGCSDIVVYGYAHDESTWNTAGKIYEWKGSNFQKLVSIQESESGGAARNRVYFYGGYIQNNTAEARSGECLQFNPKSATYWIEQSFFVPATASTARTVSIYLKDDVSFDGNVYLELWFNGAKITGPTEQTMTTSYQQFSIVGAADDIPIDGVLELKILVYGTAGCVYADDVSYS
jgi:hypothetical protein